MTTPKHEPEP